MIDWDKKLLEKLQKLDIIPEIYTRFKADIKIVTESLERGSKLEEGDENKKTEDEKKSDSKITMEVVQ